MGSIMESYTLRYESPKKYYGVLTDCELFGTQDGEWRIYEHCGPDRPEMLGLPAEVCCYSVVLEAEVSTQEQLQARQQDVLELTRDLDRVWTYAAGSPFSATPHPTLLLNKGPERWYTNYKDVDRAIERARSLSPFVIEGEWSIEPRQWIQMPVWPLKRALNILEPYRSALVETYALIELHYQSLTSRNTNRRLLILAKSLDLVESLLPGPKRASDKKQLRAFKQKQLPDEVTRELEHGQHTLHWLFGIANSKRETRHTVNEKAASLLPEITTPERRSFFHDADLIIRGVVARQFGIEPLILKL
jgi:hypothetical protein